MKFVKFLAHMSESLVRAAESSVDGYSLLK